MIPSLGRCSSERSNHLDDLGRKRMYCGSGGFGDRNTVLGSLIVQQGSFLLDLLEEWDLLQAVVFLSGDVADAGQPC